MHRSTVRSYCAETGRRGRNLRLLSKRRRSVMVILPACLSAALLIAAAAVYFLIYHEGDTANKNAQDLLSQYKQAVVENQAASADAAGALPVTTAALSGGNHARQIVGDDYPAGKRISVQGYDIIGKLRIGCIGLELPVLSQTTEQALKISVCYYAGVLPGEEGNMVITGHNYKNGAHFGNLDRLKTGDKVIFDAPDGRAYTYVVYETKAIMPDDVEALTEYQGEYVLMLVTCTNSGNGRLLVKSRLT